ncbi:MAG: VWA domain-containing protein [Candidatus Calescibacterium sp.]|nr:VWA domain-containing protein [Candidatus Calescibacterium sp.]MDW8132293.1 VWA domain-containing protein [Candidatus Calescibacterium sp.]
MEISFAFPQIFVIGFLIFPIILTLFLIHYFSRKRSVFIFAEAKMIDLINVGKLGWSRLALYFLDFLIILVLFLALGRPQYPVSLPVSGYAVGIIVDISGSMMATDFFPSRIVVAKDVAKVFINKLRGNFEACLVTFNNNVFVNQSLTSSKEDLLLALAKVDANYGGTAIGDAIMTTLAVLEGSNMPHKVIVLLTDGENNYGIDPIQAAQKARDKKIPIYCIGMGTAAGTYIPGIPYPVRIDEASLREIARITGGEYYWGSSTSSLEKIYSNLAEKVGKVKKNQDISSLFAGLALFFILIKMMINVLFIRSVEI